MSLGIRQTSGGSPRGTPSVGPVTSGWARRALGFAVVGAGLTSLAAGVYLRVRDTAFEGVARVRLQRSVSGPAKPAGPPRLALPLDLVPSECELIASEAVLRTVVEPPPRGAGWGQRLSRGHPLRAPEAIQAIRDRLETKTGSERNVIHIRVFSESSSEAAGLANDVAEAYRTFRREHRWPPPPGPSGRDLLQEKLSEIERQVAQMQQNLDQLRRSLHITDPVGGTARSSAPDTLEAERHAILVKLETQADLARQETLLAKLKGLNHDDLLRTLPVTLPDPRFNELVQDAAAANQRLTQAGKDHGPTHPETGKARGAAEEAQRRMDERAKSLLVALESKANGLKAALQNQLKELERIQAQDVQKADRNAPYWDLKRKLEEAQQDRAVIAAKVTSTATQSLESGHLEVEIVDRAEPTVKPVPQRPLLALALLGLGLVLNLGGIWLARLPGRDLSN